MLRKLFKEEKGFTMIELIIVIAIIAIIGAIVAPSFTKATTKSKIKADVASVREINRQIALYMAEKGQYPAGDSTSINGTPADTGGLVELNTAGYLEEVPVPQTAGIKFVYTAANGAVQIEGNTPNDDVKAAVNGLSPEEKQFVKEVDFE
jgi:prepilin-type N-terminal cleavage/methylation domain-containing protein